MPLDREHKDKLSQAMRNAWAKVRAVDNVDTHPSETNYTVPQVVAWLWAHYRGDWKALSRDISIHKPADPL